MARSLSSLFLALFVAAYAFTAVAADGKTNLRIDVILPPKGQDVVITVWKAVPQADGTVKLEPFIGATGLQLPLVVNTAHFGSMSAGESKAAPLTAGTAQLKSPKSEFEAAQIDATLPPGKYVLVTSKGEDGKDAVSVSDAFEITKDGKRLRVSVRDAGKKVEITQNAPQGDIGVPRDKVKQALNTAGFKTDALAMGLVPATEGELAQVDAEPPPDAMTSTPLAAMAEQHGAFYVIVTPAAGLMGAATSVQVTQETAGGTTSVRGGGDGVAGYAGLDVWFGVDLVEAAGAPTIGGLRPVVGVWGTGGGFGIGGETTDRRSLDAVNPISPDTHITSGGAAFGAGVAPVIGLEGEGFIGSLLAGIIVIDNPVEVTFEQPGGSTRFDDSVAQVQPIVGLNLAFDLGDVLGLPAVLGGRVMYAFEGGTDSQTKNDVFGQPVTVRTRSEDFFAAGLNFGIEFEW
jgi:hypothetical protein